MGEKIIKDRGKMVCPRYRHETNKNTMLGVGEASCNFCDFCKEVRTNVYECINPNKDAKPKLITYKNISNPDNMLCHKFCPDMSKIKQKYGVSLMQFFKCISEKGQKGTVIDKEKDAIPVCSVCAYCNGKGCRLGMHPHQVTKENQGKTTVVYDIKGKLNS